ncbi:MAG: Nif3-like dinuclear metal center hexameric protein [Pseudomonadota bacterium]
MAQFRELLALLEELAPARLAADWDNNGLMVGRPGAEVKKAALALDPSPQALQAAKDLGADVLITHHPLIFKPLKKIDLDEPTAQALALALKWDLAVACAHTSLDAAANGVSLVLANRLGLEAAEVLEPLSETEGFGRLGRLPEPLPFTQLLKKVKRDLKLGGARFVPPRRELVSVIAVMGGSGGSYAALAKARGADVLITGDIGYHHARDAESLRIGLIDAGHWGTERPVLEELAENLARLAAEKSLDLDFQVLFFEEDPWHFMED